MLDFSHLTDNPNVNIQSFFGDSDAATNLTDWKVWTKPRGVKWVYMIAVGAGATYGYAVISSVTSNTVASVATTQYLIPHPTTGIITAASYYITQRPISSLENSAYRAPDAKTTGFSTSPVTTGVFGVDVTETQVAGASGSKYKPAHAGWVGVHTYTDMHGNLRVKSETLVAMSGISTGVPTYTSYGDANDNARYPNS